MYEIWTIGFKPYHWMTNKEVFSKIGVLVNYPMLYDFSIVGLNRAI